MTREEAIARLKNTAWLGSNNDRESTEEAVRMAIEALNLQPTCNQLATDLISRQDALKPFCIAPDGTRIPEVDCDNFPVEFSVEFIKKHLLSLPSADRSTGECRTCRRNADNGGVHEDGRTKCPIQEHYALLLDGYCHLYEPYCGAKMKGADDED